MKNSKFLEEGKISEENKRLIRLFEKKIKKEKSFENDSGYSDGETSPNDIFRLVKHEDDEKSIADLTDEIIAAYKGKSSAVILTDVGPAVEKLLEISCMRKRNVSEFKKLLEAFPCLAFYKNEGDRSLFHTVFTPYGGGFHGIHPEQFKILLNAIEKNPEAESLSKQFGSPFLASSKGTPLHKLFRLYGYFYSPQNQEDLNPLISRMLRMGANPSLTALNENGETPVELLSHVLPGMEAGSELRKKLCAKLKKNKAIFTLLKPIAATTRKNIAGAAIEPLFGNTEIARMIANQTDYTGWLENNSEENADEAVSKVATKSPNRPS